MAADSLVARRRAMPDGGSAWRSSMQAPHHHTDRDVGAASIGAGLLAAYAVTGDHDYLRAARAAGDFLLGVAEPAAGGLRWPDWADPDGRRSDTHFTSFDDGAAGISDYLWTLYDVTHESRFRTGALAGVRWLVAQAEGRSCPETACSWRWTDDPDWRVQHYGVGMGQAGIVLVLDTFADRTNDSTFRAYARAGAARLRALTANGTRPLPRSSDESATHETGFLSGSAGAAYMFLERYRRDRDPVDLATARRLLAWVDDQAGRGLGGNGQLAVRRRRGCLDGLGLRARSRRDRVGEPAGRPYDRRRRLPRACAPGRKLAAARRRPRRRLGRAARRCRLSAARRTRQRRRRDRLGARGPGPRGHRHGRQPLCRAHGARRAPHRGAPRPARGVLVREPDERRSTAARRAVLALGRRRNRRVRRSARRLVRADPGGQHGGWPPATDKIGATPCARTPQPRRFASSRCTRLRARP